MFTHANVYLNLDMTCIHVANISICKHHIMCGMGQRNNPNGSKDSPDQFQNALNKVIFITQTALTLRIHTGFVYIYESFMCGSYIGFSTAHSV